MTAPEIFQTAIIFLAGIWAGGINVIVGSGSLVTFPTMLLFGIPPLTANISNNIGMVAGGLSGIVGYRRELRPNRDLLVRLAPASLLGGIVGALLLLVLPSETFGAVVPVLIALGMVMVVVGPIIQRRSARRSVERLAAGEIGDEPAAGSGASTAARPGVGMPASLGGRIATGASVFAIGVYGGYFGAAQGILLIGALSMALTIGLVRVGALKNVLATLVNLIAAVVFVIVAGEHIDWRLVATIGSGSLIGGYLGARIGRRLSPTVLRVIILVIGAAALVRIVFFA